MQLFFEQLLNGIAMGSIYAPDHPKAGPGIRNIANPPCCPCRYLYHRCLHGPFFVKLSGSLVVGVVGSTAFCAMLGVAIERFVYYPLMKYPPYVPLIGSIAVMLAIEELCRLIAGPHILTLPARSKDSMTSAKSSKRFRSRS